DSSRSCSGVMAFEGFSSAGAVTAARAARVRPRAVMTAPRIVSPTLATARIARPDLPPPRLREGRSPRGRRSGRARATGGRGPPPGDGGPPPPRRQKPPLARPRPSPRAQAPILPAAPVRGYHVEEGDGRDL